MKKIKTFFNVLWLWIADLFRSLTGKKLPVPVEPAKKPENVDMIKQIRVMAFVIGMTRTQVETDLKKELTGENLALGMEELKNVYGELERIPREWIRKYRKQNGLSFSKLVKQRVK